MRLIFPWLLPLVQLLGWPAFGTTIDKRYMLGHDPTVCGGPEL